MEKSIIAVIGTPKSGLSILSQCLNILGLTSLKSKVQDDISIIHALMFQEMLELLFQVATHLANIAETIRIISPERF